MHSAFCLETITPEFIRENGKRSVAVLKSYQDFWKAHDARIYEDSRDSRGALHLDRFYFYVDMDAHSVNKWSRINFPAEYGMDEGQVNASQLGYTFHLGNDRHRLGAFVFGDFFGMNFNDEQRARAHYAQTQPQATFDPFYIGWDYGSLLTGCFYQHTEHGSIRVGVQEDNSPLTRSDAQHQELFVLEPDAHNYLTGVVYTTHPFWELQWHQYRFSTLWSRAGSLEDILIALGPFALGAYAWEPTLIWRQPARRHLLINRLARTRGIGGGWGVSRQSLELSLGDQAAEKVVAGVQTEASLFENRSSQKGLDAYVGGALSLHGLGTDLYLGAQGGVYLERLFSVLDMKVEYAYNLSSDILQFGPDPQGVLHMNLRIAW